ncbi:hypothetical protein LPN01_09110 [Sphingomonas sp. A2-49]|uniref:hypothetical protein n=1 Tax=Sphingomonas sp. A2-49 TaxID=1391375 RepID=UPI0021D25C3A|nr:hypothetical protein [Sphingomonas sp. A2-49]MCU6454236.1 hypothetical protein [Sphingomonas sp. A2-49]
MAFLGGHRGKGGRHRVALLVPLLVPSLVGMPMLAMSGSAGAQTRAGVRVVNVATLSVRDGDGERTLPSNPASLTVAERLDLTLDPGNDARVDIGSGGGAVAVVLVNRGNGSEAFDLAAQPSDATVTIRGVAIDRDGDGRFDAATDALLTDGRTPALDPGATLRLLVLVDPAATPVTVATIDVTARAVTGTGPAGTVFAGQGDGGGDAVTGATTARATLAVAIGAAPPPAAQLVKSQSVRAPDGSDRPVNGAIITYRLEARILRAAAAVRIDDPIPQGTLYVPGSLTLDGAPLSDAAGDDAGRADDAGIAVTLGDVAGATTRIVQFKVSIQ